MSRSEKVDKLLFPLELATIKRLAELAILAEKEGEIETAQAHLSRVFNKASEAYATAQRIINTDEYIHGKAGASS